MDKINNKFDDEYNKIHQHTYAGISYIETICYLPVYLLRLYWISVWSTKIGLIELYRRIWDRDVHVEGVLSLYMDEAYAP